MSGRDSVGGREVEKFWLAGSMEEGNCSPHGCKMHECWLWRGPEKVKTNTNGGAYRYTSNQRKRQMKVRVNVSDIPGLQANEWWGLRVSGVEYMLHRPDPDLLTIYCIVSVSHSPFYSFTPPCVLQRLNSNKSCFPSSAPLCTNNLLMRAWLQGVCGGPHLFEPYVFLAGRAKIT